MQFTEIINALSSDPQQMAKSMLRLFHFAGLALGLGAATVLDLIVLRFFMMRRVSTNGCEIFHFCANLVLVGIAMMWITGIGFLLFYQFYDPDLLMNEKIWAKVAIVGILTLNGVFVHRFISPFITDRTGHMLMEGIPLQRKLALITVGTLSFVSWYGPLAIANLPQLNFSVPMLQILAVYAGILAAILVAAYLFAWITQFKAAAKLVKSPARHSKNMKRSNSVV